MNLREESPSIAIIGGGFSGTMVAVHLLKNPTAFKRIQLIERRSICGTGVAYGVDSDCFLLNVPAGKMSAFPDQPLHFLNWLQTHQQCSKNYTANCFVPRRLYGEYLQSILQDAVAHSPLKLERIKSQATNLEIVSEPNRQATIITLKDGRKLHANKVVLALGNFPPSNPPISHSSFYTSPRYIRDIWATNALTSIPDHPILILGTGLTLIDVVLALKERGHQAPIYAVSRHGKLPLPHQLTPPLPAFEFAELPNQIRPLLRQVREQVKRMSEAGSPWQAVIDSLRPQTQLIWQNLSLEEQQRFLRHLRPYWEIHRHRTAPIAHQKIIELIESKQLTILAGRIQSYQETSQDVTVKIQQRSSGKILTFCVGTVINCTGPESHYLKLADPLVQNLFAAGYITPDPLAMGFLATAKGETIGANGMTSQILYTLGASQKGQLWETTAIPELRQQAANVAQELSKLPLLAG